MTNEERLMVALEEMRPAFGNPNMLEQGRKMLERKQAEQIELSAQRVKSDLLARALMRRYNPETLFGLTDTPRPQTLDEAAGLDPRVDRSTFLPYSKKEGFHVPAVAADLMKLATASNPQYSNLMQPEEAMLLATNLMGGGMAASRLAPAPAGSLGMNVFHGSPHKFDKFDMSKIGTGEGAQAYGHGLYFAENPSVAGEYARMNITGPGQVAHIGAKNGPDGAMQALKNVYPKMPKQWYESAIANAETAGAFYKVDLPDAQIAKFLDWDKPLSQQSWYRPVADVVKEYKGAGKGVDDYARLIAKANARGSDVTGRQLYEGMLSQFGGSQAKVSEFMRDAGIPGIRYLDGGSRAGGKGTSNFVVFDPAHMNILERNGVTLEQALASRQDVRNMMNSTVPEPSLMYKDPFGDIE